MFNLKIENINDYINSKLMKRYQISIDNLMGKINLKLLEGSDMMG
jgi:hypothetical protein